MIDKELMTIGVIDFARWKDDPITRRFFYDIRRLEETSQQQLLSGVTLSIAGQEIKNTAQTIGYLKALNDVLNLSIVEVTEDDDTNEL